MSEARALTMVAGGKLAPLVPTTFDEVARLAKLAYLAGMFPNENEAKGQAQATMAILQGLDVGVPPMQAIQSIAVINGRCVIWGDLVPALIWSKGHKIKEWIEGEGDKRVAHCKITRGDNGEEIERTFSVLEAKEAELWGRGVWKKFPRRMLQMRARGFATRDGVADVMRGMYIREEIEEEREPRDITPARPSPAPLVPPPPPPLAISAVTVEPTGEESQAEEFDPTAFLAHLDDVLSRAADEDALSEAWQLFEIEIEDRLSRGEREDAANLYENHLARIRGASGAGRAA